MEAVGLEVFARENIEIFINLLLKIQTSEIHEEADP